MDLERDGVRRQGRARARMTHNRPGPIRLLIPETAHSRTSDDKGCVQLLANAVKFTPPSGRVGLEVRGD
jgi:hypothetical protein